MKATTQSEYYLLYLDVRRLTMSSQTHVSA
jgi:hypothetical protein